MSEHEKKKDREMPDLGNLIGNLDIRLSSHQLAEKVTFSRSHFYRLASKEWDRPIMQTRRRLLLERAAWQLLHTNRSVTEIAFEATFETLEGFSRAFRRHYRILPSKFRIMAPTEFRLNPTERVHFCPSSISQHHRENNMSNNTTSLNSFFAYHHKNEMGKMLDFASKCNDSELDKSIPLENYWLGINPSLRTLLGKASAFAAPWMEAILSQKTDYQPESLAEMKIALNVNVQAFLDILTMVETDRSWDLTFVDSVCEPPEVFTYGGMIWHVITGATMRTEAIRSEMQVRGLAKLGSGDPISTQI